MKTAYHTVEKMASNSRVDDLIKEYFKSERTYVLILQRLREVHGVKRSLIWLKLRLKYLGLKRRGGYASDDTVKSAIARELRTSPQLFGYRAMWRHITVKYKLHVKRATVMKLLRELDPEGVTRRKSKYLKRRLYHNKGPNYLWHMDGYDKLSPYGLAIHGCIDGFSRKVLWLELTPTNHDPKVISRFYLLTVEEIGGVPKFLRSDYGTENCIVASLQIAFHITNLKERSYIYGPSKRNVKIEGWWSQLRKSKTSWWIDLLKDLKESSYFDGSAKHKHAIAYCMAHIIEFELKEFQKAWNSHTIRNNTKSLLPSGIPDDLYQMPQTYGVDDHVQPINSFVWIYGMNKESKSPPRFCPYSFELRAKHLLSQSLGIEQHNITAENCVNVYKYLIDNMP